MPDGTPAVVVFSSFPCSKNKHNVFIIHFLLLLHKIIKMDLLNCPTCYQITLADCFEKITVKAGLGAAETFFYRVTDKFGNRYSGEILTDAEGNFEINASDFPPALFNPHAGTFELQVFKSLQNCEAETLTFCDVEYTCVQMDFAHEDSTEDLSEQIIPCNCPEEEAP